MDTVILGAGVAGLACARALDDAGVRVVVLDKGRGVGGRCATRRVGGRAVDHGLPFFHGSDPALRDTLLSAGAFAWPLRVEGSGTPCAPAAFRPGQWRLAFAEGMTRFPKALAAGLDVRLGIEAVGLATGDGHATVVAKDGSRFEAERLVLALPAPQARRLLDTLPRASAAVRSAAALLAGISTVRCLTWIAGYDETTPAPSWDVLYPRGSAILQLVSHDSAKRESGPPVLVLHARPRWAAAHWDAPDWADTMAAEASARPELPSTTPRWTDTRRWRFARLSGGDALRGPLDVGPAGGARIGIAGEAFDPAAGVEGAWLSGRALARRWTEERRR